jgi:hypothetical protein
VLDTLSNEGKLNYSDKEMREGDKDAKGINTKKELACHRR